QLELSLLLPDALDRRDACVTRLTETLDGSPGVEDVHLVDTEIGGTARLCLHYDPALTNVNRIRSRAETAGVELTERYGHALWSVNGGGHVRRARSVQETLVRADGVMEAEIVPGLARIEFDRTVLDEHRLRDVLAEREVWVVDAHGPRD